MGRFVKGDVVVTPFPFSDLSVTKRRPALVVATLTGDDVLLCQITGQVVSDSYAIPLSAADFASGKLTHDSNIRPNRLFTADSNIILYRAGVLKPEKMKVTKGLGKMFDLRRIIDRRHDTDSILSLKVSSLLLFCSFYTIFHSWQEPLQKRRLSQAKP